MDPAQAWMSNDVLTKVTHTNEDDDDDDDLAAFITLHCVVRLKSTRLATAEVPNKHNG